MTCSILQQSSCGNRTYDPSISSRALSSLSHPSSLEFRLLILTVCRRCRGCRRRTRDRDPVDEVGSSRRGCGGCVRASVAVVAQGVGYGVGQRGTVLTERLGVGVGYGVALATLRIVLLTESKNKQIFCFKMIFKIFTFKASGKMTNR